MSLFYQPNSVSSTTHHQEPARRTAGTLRISPDYTESVRVLRAAVKANREAGRWYVPDERVDDVSIEVIDTIPLLDPAARRTLRVVAGVLRRACAGPQPRRRADGNGNGNGHAAA